jgi:hypothetical protein
MQKMGKIKTIPNPKGPPVKIGDKVKITSGEWIGYVGEITEFVENAGQWIKTVKTLGKDGEIKYIEVKSVVLDLAGILEKLGRTGAFKKLWGWFTNLFRKKANKK